jgi:hypothetical protein
MRNLILSLPQGRKEEPQPRCGACASLPALRLADPFAITGPRGRGSAVCWDPGDLRRRQDSARALSVWHSGAGTPRKSDRAAAAESQAFFLAAAQGSGGSGPVVRDRAPRKNALVADPRDRRRRRFCSRGRRHRLPTFSCALCRAQPLATPPLRKVGCAPPAAVHTFVACRAGNVDALLASLPPSRPSFQVPTPASASVPLAVGLMDVPMRPAFQPGALSLSSPPGLSAGPASPLPASAMDVPLRPSFQPHALPDAAAARKSATDAVLAAMEAPVVRPRFQPGLPPG